MELMIAIAFLFVLAAASLVAYFCGRSSDQSSDGEPMISDSERRMWHYNLYRSHGGSSSYEEWRKVQRMWGS